MPGLLEATHVRPGPHGDLYITQPYERYTKEITRPGGSCICECCRGGSGSPTNDFCRGSRLLCFDPQRIPRLEEVNRFLRPVTGFQAKAVAGYIPAFLFFDCLRNREFPTTVTIRSSNRLDYLPEPDIFHDIAGHVPMHTDRAFAETLVRFGECAHTAAEIVAGIRDQATRLQRLTSIMRAMARFFWFTIEFGLVRSGVGLKAYGSGLLSSFGELQNALTCPQVRALSPSYGVGD